MIVVESRESYLQEVSKMIGEKSVVVELGVLNGDFSQMLLDIVNPLLLFLVDPFEVNKQKYDDGLPTAYSTKNDHTNVLARFNSQINSNQVVVDKNYSHDVVGKYGDRVFDFIYIDACHLYECVKKDLNDWLPKLKKDGIIGLHDYYVMYGFGVVQAVEEFCIEHNFEIVLINNNGHDVALKQK